VGVQASTEIAAKRPGGYEQAAKRIANISFD